MIELLVHYPLASVVVGAIPFLLFALVCRRLRTKSTIENETVTALQRISQAIPDLRHGLTEEAADRAAPHLRELLRCVAIGIVDRNGSLLCWDGEANEHYADLTEATSRAINGPQREQVNHDQIACRRSGCPMGSAVIVPLPVDGDIEGALVVVGGSDGKRLLRMANEIAHFVCTQLELAKLDESREQLAQAEVRALRAQISPHFVYNALNTISSLIRTDPERARELLVEFAEFTRYSFRTHGLFTTLAEELLNIDRYLTLESARFGPRLKVRLKIAPEVLSVTVPFLVVQPLVENAVRHGLAGKPGGGTVTVVAQDNGADALISVEDDGVGMDADRLLDDLVDAHSTGEHVGVGNINQRMRSLYGNEYALVVETAPGAGMKVILRVPKSRAHFQPVLTDYPDARPTATESVTDTSSSLDVTVST